MMTTVSPSNQKNDTWKFLLGFYIIIFFLFWFGVLTNLSWVNQWIAIAFSILVSIISLITFFRLKGLRKLSFSLMLSLSVLSFLMAVLSGVFNFVTGNYVNLIPSQSIISPDGTRIEEIYCGKDNSHGVMSDHIEFKVRHIRIPFLHRDLGLYSNYSSQKCIYDEKSLVSGEDNNIIYVVEAQSYILVDTIKGEGALFNPGVIDGTK